MEVKTSIFGARCLGETRDTTPRANSTLMSPAQVLAMFLIVVKSRGEEQHDSICGIHDLDVGPRCGTRLTLVLYTLRLTLSPPSLAGMLRSSDALYLHVQIS